MNLAKGADPMNEITQSLGAQELQASLEAWFNTHVLALDNAIQVGLIILALLIGRLLGARLRRVIGERVRTPALAYRCSYRCSPYRGPLHPNHDAGFPVGRGRGGDTDGSVRQSLDANGREPHQRLGGDPSGLRAHQERSPGSIHRLVRMDSCCTHHSRAVRRHDSVARRHGHDLR